MVILPLDYEIEKQMQIQDTKMDNQEVYPNDYSMKHTKMDNREVYPNDFPMKHI